MRSLTLFGMTLVVMTLGCGSASEPGQSNVSLTFRFDGEGGGVSAASAAVAASGAQGPLVIQGADGATLEITDIRLIVDELKLERQQDACEGLDEVPPELEDQCARFEAPPQFLPVPLAEGEVGEVEALVPEGVYVALKFETKAPADEESALLLEVRAEFPEWPGQASAVVVGTFFPAEGGDARPFTAFFDAEVKVVMDLPEPLVVQAGADGSITVFVDPAIWFVDPDGLVIDLSVYDFTAEDPVVPKLEAKFEDMITKIEVE